MLITITRPIDVEAKSLRVEFPLRYLDEEDSGQASLPEAPEGVPGRHGNRYWLDIDIDTGKVIDWPPGQTVRLHEKVVDEGTYTLLGLVEGSIIHRTQEDYVPGFMPGDHYGDYIILDIEADGTITNWNRGRRGAESYQGRIAAWVNP